MEGEKAPVRGAFSELLWTVAVETVGIEPTSAIA
jgi:hypothetical protein